MKQQLSAIIMKLKFGRALVFAILLAASCHTPECDNQNPVFNDNKPTSKIYKDELVRVMKKDSVGIRFFVGRLYELQNQRQFYVKVKSDSICATMVLNVKRYGPELQQFVKVKGMSYGNAEISNLKFDIVQGKDSTDFVYKSLDGFID